MESVRVPMRRLLQDEEDYRTEWPLESLRCKTAFALTTDDDLQWTTVRQEEKVEVSEFLLDHFFPQVPIGKIVNMDVNREIRPWLADFIETVLAASPASIAVRTRKDGRLVALAVNIIERLGGEPSPDITQFVDPVQHPLMHMNMAFLEELSIFPDDCPAASQMMNVFMVAVAPQYGKRGLASKLIQLSVVLAGRLGIEMVVSQAVNYYAIRALEKCGFRSVKQVLYGDFVYEGTTPLANNGVHQKAELMVLRQLTN